MKLLKRFLLGSVLIVVLFAGYFLLIKKLDRAVREEAIGPVMVGHTPTLLPALFRDGRLYLRIPAPSGDTLLTLCDSGGGLSMLMPSRVEADHLGSFLRTGLVRGVMPVQYALFREICTDPAIPGPVPLRSLPLRGPFARITEPYLLLPPAAEATETDLMQEIMANDAFLGQNFFMGHAWTIDYGREELWVNTPINPSGKDAPGVQRMGLQRNQAGDAVFGHGRMAINVDGEPIDVLFDTGASLVLTEAGRQVFHTTAKSIGGSFIARSVFAKWHAAHPQWPVHEKADAAGDVIEVPQVVVGTDTVGPVSFASRPDEIWSKGMIATMDSVVQGAIGGSVLHYFKVTVDYNSALIKFERVRSTQL